MRTGQVIADRYRVDRVVRRGTQSVLVAAWDQHLNRPVALKIVALDPYSDGMRQRLEREVTILRRLDHPRIVRCYDAGVLSDVQVYLALEWLDGQDLAQLLREGPVTLRTALTVLAQVANALDAAHRQGIIHRDIKPANIFVANGSGVDCRVLDFGVAKVPKGVDRITQTGAILGTPNYMAPEQASTAVSVDGRADLYSLGVVGFELITRRLPFVASTDLARLARILVEEATPVLKVVPSLPRPAAELIDGMLVRSVQGRIATAEAVEALAHGTLQALPDVLLDRVYPATDVADEDDGFEDGPHRTTPLVMAETTDGSQTQLPLAAPQGGLIGGASVVEPLAAWSAIAPDLREPARPDNWRPRHHFDVTESLPIFGRDAEITHCVERVGTALRSRHSAFQLVVGPGGSGKSRMRSALVSRLAAAPQPPLIYSGRTDEGRQRVPFDFIRRVLFSLSYSEEEGPGSRTLNVLAMLPSAREVRTLVSGARPFEVEQDDAEHERAVVAAFAAEALGLRYPETGAVVSSRSSPQLAGPWLVRSLALLLVSQARAEGLVLVVDDVHWLDPGSARVLRAVLAPGRSSPVAVVGFGSPTLLDPEVTATWPLADLATADAVIRLGPLSPSDARRLVRSLLVAPAVDRDVDRVVKRAAGNALYLEHLTRALVETGAWRNHGGRMRWIGESMFPTVSSAITARLECRSTIGQRVITAAAVFGPVFWAEGVAEVSGLPLEAVLEELNLLGRQGWVRRRQGSRYAGQSELEFTHGALQAVVVARLQRRRRRAYEAKATAFLISVGEAEPAVLGQHELAAGRPASPTFLAAAERALHLGDLRTAAQLAEDALGFADAQMAPLELALWSVLESVAWATADWARGQEALAALARQAPTPSALVDLTCRRSRLALRTGRLAEAQDAVAEAATIASKAALSGPLAAQVRLHEAEVAERVGEIRSAQKLFAQAHRGFEKRREWSDYSARCSAGVGRCALARADYAMAEDRLRPALVHARTHHKNEQLVEVYGGLVEVSRQSGDLRRARTLVREIEQVDLGLGRNARSHLLRGLLAAEAGRWADAQLHLEESVTEAAVPDAPQWMFALVALSQIYRLPADNTPGLSRSRSRLVRLHVGVQAALDTAREGWPAWLPSLALAGASIGALLRQLDRRSVELATQQFEREGVMAGDEPAGVAFALARLTMTDDRYPEAGQDFLRQAVRCVDGVAARMSVDKRPRYLRRPFIVAIIEQARVAEVAMGPDPNTHRLMAT